MHKLLRILFYCSILAFGAKTFAAEDWRITNFSSDIALQSDGQVRIVEIIGADFGDVEKHGIYRDIPTVYENSSNREKTYTKIAVQSVQANDTNIPYELQTNSGYLRIKIGDPDRLLSGSQIYSISYLASGILRNFKTYDELYWNVTGNAWPVPIEKTETTVHLPRTEVLQSSCYFGVSGATTPCEVSRENSQTIKAVQPQTLSPGEGLTVAVGYTSGMVPILTIPRPKTFQDVFLSSLTWSTFGITFLVGFFLLIQLWWRVGRDHWWRRKNLHDAHQTEGTLPLFAHDPIIVEYDSPENLRPAEIGVLLDERADTLDISATIVDLAVRGYLTITEEPKKWAWGKSDYTLHQTAKSPTKLLKYEELLLDGLFSGRSEVKISSLKYAFYKDLKKVKDALYIEMTEKEIFTENPQRVRARYTIWGFLILFLGVGIFFSGISSLQAIVFGMGTALISLSIALLVVAQIALPRRTARGRELYRQAKGYELFIGHTEEHRQQFFEKENTFMTVLPYAIVFGLTKKLAEAMKDMGMTPPQPGWYSGVNAFNVMAFSENIGNFSDSLNSVLASTPGGSGSGGGGSSGGGFGGGGGGSW